MRKIAICMGVFLLLLSFSGCDLISEDKALENVSLLQNYYYVGESDSFVVEMKGGMRESPCVVDGSAGKLHDYVKIKATAKSAIADASLQYKIGINEEEFEGQLTRDVIGSSYSAVIAANELCEDYNLSITFGGKTEVVALRSVMKADCMTYAAAREIAESELKTQIARMSEEGGYEVHIKYVEGKLGSGEYLWYVAYLCEGETNAVLISPTENKVIAKRG